MRETCVITDWMWVVGRCSCQLLWNEVLKPHVGPETGQWSTGNYWSLGKVCICDWLASGCWQLLVWNWYMKLHWKAPWLLWSLPVCRSRHGRHCRKNYSNSKGETVKVWWKLGMENVCCQIKSYTFFMCVGCSGQSWNGTAFTLKTNVLSFWFLLNLSQLEE